MSARLEGIVRFRGVLRLLAEATLFAVQRLRTWKYLPPCTSTGNADAFGRDSDVHRFVHVCLAKEFDVHYAYFLPEVGALAPC